MADEEADFALDGESASIGDAEDWPPSKRHCGEKLGIGFTGIPLVSLADMPEKVQPKQCSFCEKTCSSPDDLVETNTMAWYKPRWQGKAAPPSPP